MLHADEAHQGLQECRPRLSVDALLVFAERDERPPSGMPGAAVDDAIYRASLRIAEDAAEELGRDLGGTYSMCSRPSRLIGCTMSCANACRNFSGWIRSWRSGLKTLGTSGRSARSNTRSGRSARKVQDRR